MHRVIMPCNHMKFLIAVELGFDEHLGQARQSLLMSVNVAALVGANYFLRLCLV